MASADPRAARLEALYLADSGTVHLTGTQALVRLLLTQRRLDEAAGLDTAGFVAGYRGSPLGGFDQALWAAAPLLARRRIRHLAAVNEELAATAVTGTQQAAVLPRPRHRGVFGMWYGKGPGLDRAGDAIKHGNHLGASPRGGVLVVVGDDHGGVSSSYPHQSDLAFQSFLMPVLHPADVGELIACGLWGWALSRFAGCWVGMKAVSEVVESAAPVDVGALPRAFRRPEGFEPPPGGLHIGAQDFGPPVEARMMARLQAVAAFVAANPIDRVVVDAPAARRGIVVVGKAYGALRAALEGLGVDPERARALGLRILKVAMPWPLDGAAARRFAEGLEEILVVEEKQPLVEGQLRDLLYDLPAARRPRILGKRDAAGRPLLPRHGELPEELLAPVLADWLGIAGEPMARARLQALRQAAEAAARVDGPRRTPFFCPGCPHNRSTCVPEDGIGLAGVGCHYLAARMQRRTVGLTAMGCEGANWVGAAPFSGLPHAFQNMGEGTYYHSGLLAIRQAVAAGVTMTFKLLYNDAVAMTGGQPVDGPLSVTALVAQLEAEGVAAVSVVAEDPAALRRAEPGLRARVLARGRLAAEQARLRAVEGVTVLVYVQTCAAEKRRRRRRGRLETFPRRVFIHPDVCEDCGDCVVQSNCIAVVPVRGPHGRRHRAIDQSACNRDYTCLEGLCPSLVTVEGVRPRVAGRDHDPAKELLPAPVRAPVSEPVRILLAGVGGTGVVTAASILAEAAAHDGLVATTLDYTGMAQKGGAVLSHVTLAPAGRTPPTPRIGAARADLLIGCDLVVAASPEAVRTVRGDSTRAVLNLHEAQTGASVVDPAVRLDGEALLARLRGVLGVGLRGAVDATELARRLDGETAVANVLLLGFAWQQGLVPLSLEAVERALAALGPAAERNRRAFHWGRLAAHDPERLARLAGVRPRSEADPEAEAAARAEALVGYQGEALARRYRALVGAVRAAARARAPEAAPRLERAVARTWFRVLAPKDAYEVARLYTDGRLEAALAEVFEGRPRVRYHFAWPPLAGRDAVTGRPRKRAWGPWVRPLLRLLAAMRRLRGGALDPLRWTREAREARALAAEYETTVRWALERLSPDNAETVAELLAYADHVRGFGAVRRARLAEARRRREALMARLGDRPAPAARAA
ncbi:indolepyruvate ferredoxin oxidoreductase family protein [Inmirania thermothiophila]|uniref:Indolepyruvate ferredoxin oxidoreductase n=1 Tax=Inmirania thermothiophila TaxID=1750597 RepID=A0A3N1Y0Y2_9GAMM|nr:indolepyruvate ferredoxin oxidoreductase family protein [Inmirania thermothiophila]ROR32191.1 indolepyruvate ferredoxin oxidoreductase [Inmirania thermothiophila]